MCLEGGPQQSDSAEQLPGQTVHSCRLVWHERPEGLVLVD